MASKTTPVVVSIVDRVSAELAEAFDSRATILVSCRLAHEGMEGLVKGAEANDRRKAISLATTRALAARLYPNDEAAQERAKTVPNNRPGGASVSESAIKQRANAYAHVLAAGLTPDILNVTAAFRLHSITGKGHAEKVDAITDKVLKGEGDFSTLADEASDALTAARPGKGARNAGGEGSDTGAALTPDAVFAVLDWTLANLDSAFQGDQRAALVDRLANLSAALA